MEAEKEWPNRPRRSGRTGRGGVAEQAEEEWWPKAEEEQAEEAR
jgi:hypothetical protein